MALKLEDKPTEDYDEGKSSWRTNLGGDGLEDSYNARSATDDDLPEGHPDHSQASSPVELQGAEKEAKGPSGSKADASEGKQLGKQDDWYDSEKVSKIMATVNTVKGRKKLLLGAGGGIVGLIMLGIGIFGFMNVFKLDHFLQNIDAKTMSRYNAQFTNRSNAYVKAYIRLRMMQIDGRSLGDADGNLYFRAHNVSTGNAVKDWWQTMATSSFEKDLLEKDGIAFTSVAVPDGNGSFKLRAGKITIKDESIGYDPYKELSPNTISRLTSGNPADLASAVNELGSNMDNFVQTQIFDSDKAVRRDIKKVVNDKTHFWQVIKRRRVRKNIQNMIGVRNWTFFERTITKYQEKKSNIQQKIVKKIFPSETELGSFLQCIFVGTCNSSNDPADTIAHEEVIPNADTATNDTTDSKGNPKQETVDLGGRQLAQEVEQATTEELAQDTTKAVESDSSTITQRIIQKIVSQFVGEEVGNTAGAAVGDPTKWWQIAKKVAKFNDMVQNHTISKMVKKARLAQYLAIYTMFATARDQSKTGELTANEMQDLMGTIKGFENSEGFQKLTEPASAATASAATTQSSTTNLSKNE